MLPFPSNLSFPGARIVSASIEPECFAMCNIFSPLQGSAVYPYAKQMKKLRFRTSEMVEVLITPTESESNHTSSVLDTIYIAVISPY